MCPLKSSLTGFKGRISDSAFRSVIISLNQNKNHNINENYNEDNINNNNDI